MIKYCFTIYGNQEDKEGNPIPYLRSTRNSQWNEATKRYNAWKDYVRKAFFEMAKIAKPSSEYNLLELTSFKKGKPIDMKKGVAADVSVVIFFANNTHGDGDNVFKGIVDALFVNDKEIRAGKFTSIVSPLKKGYVDVTITIY